MARPGPIIPAIVTNSCPKNLSYHVRSVHAQHHHPVLAAAEVDIEGTPEDNTTEVDDAEESESDKRIDD